MSLTLAEIPKYCPKSRRYFCLLILGLKKTGEIDKQAGSAESIVIYYMKKRTVIFFIRYMKNSKPGGKLCKMDK